MEDFSATKSETRKFRTLALYFNHLQLKGEASLEFSHLVKEDYEELKSHPRHWIGMDRRFQKELKHYLNSPVPENSDELFLGKITSSENCDSSSSTSSCFESQDELEHVFHALWDVHPGSPFHTNDTGLTSSDVAEDDASFVEPEKDDS